MYSTIAKLRSDLASTCADFYVELVEMDFKCGHIHLLNNYLPNLAISNLASSFYRRAQ